MDRAIAKRQGQDALIGHMLRVRTDTPGMADMAHANQGNAMGPCAFCRQRGARHCRDHAEAIVTVEKHNLPVIRDRGVLRQRIDLVLIEQIEVLWQAHNTMGVDAGKIALHQMVRYHACRVLGHTPGLQQSSAHRLKCVGADEWHGIRSYGGG